MRSILETFSWFTRSNASVYHLVTTPSSQSNPITPLRSNLKSIFKKLRHWMDRVLEEMIQSWLKLSPVLKRPSSSSRDPTPTLYFTGIVCTPVKTSQALAV